VVGGIIYFGITSGQSGQQPQTGQNGLVLHWRVTLNITDLRRPANDDKVAIPGNIGVPGGLWANHTLDSYGGTFAPLNTQSENGTIQIELTKVRPQYPFTLGDFFNIWGVPLSHTCVWNYCDSTLFPFMDTKANHATEICINPAYQLYDGDSIQIILGGRPLDPLSCT
jgi:hypothetical protein